MQLRDPNQTVQATTGQTQVIDLNNGSGAQGSVDDVADWYAAQIKDWDRADDLIGGTSAMRDAGEKYLTRFPLESTQAFGHRLKQTVLTNFYKDHMLAALNIIFSEPIQIKESKIPEDHLTNIDNQGHDVEAFAKKIAVNLLKYGMHHVLVDMPVNPGAETVEDDQRLNLRPYWVLVPAKRLFNAFFQIENNIKRLTQVRITDVKTIYNGFAQQSNKAIKVFYDNENGVYFETWISQNGGKYELSNAPADTQTLKVSQIPIVTFHTNDDEFMISPSIMNDIAHKNVEHWQSSSDQRNILTVSRYPIMYQIGIDAPVADLGPTAILHSEGTETPHQAVTFGYIEPTGKGIEAGERDLNRIVQEANTLSIRLQSLSRKYEQTATGDVLDFTLSSSPLHLIAQAIENGINRCLLLHALWMGLKPEDAGKCEISKDFGVNANETARISEIGTARRAGDISLETYFAEMSQLGVYKTEVDIDLEKERIASENVALFAQVKQPSPPRRTLNEQTGKPPGESPPLEEAKAA